MTRQRQSAQIFAATETARDVRQLSRQMNRGEVRSASVAWATREDLPADLRSSPSESEERGAVPTQRATSGERPPAAASPAPVPEHGWLIAPRLSDKPIDRGDVAAAVAGDPAVKREREALGRYLEGAFRDPREAATRLAELVKRDGPTSAARRMSADPGQLGELRGRVGLLTGSGAPEERAAAMRVAKAVGPAVARIGEAEATAASGYRTGVEARRAAEATGVPKLSQQAREALAALSETKDDTARAEAWKVVRENKGLVREVDRFMRAVEGRFGAEGVRAFARNGVVESAKIAPGERAVLGEVGWTVQAARIGQRAVAAQTDKLAVVQRLISGASLKP